VTLALVTSGQPVDDLAGCGVEFGVEGELLSVDVNGRGAGYAEGLKELDDDEEFDDVQSAMSLRARPCRVTTCMATDPDAVRTRRTNRETTGRRYRPGLGLDW
jgi:hypothetical protein